MKENKWEKDDEIAYRSRKQTAKFLNEKYSPLGIEVIYGRDLNKNSTAKKSKRHSMFLRWKDSSKPNSIQLEIRIEYRKGSKHINPAHYLRIPKDKITDDPLKDTEQVFGKAWFLYLSSQQCLETFKEFDQYFTINIGHLIKNIPPEFLKYGMSEGNETKISIDNWNPTWYPIKETKAGFFGAKGLGENLHNILSKTGEWIK